MARNVDSSSLGAGLTAKITNHVVRGKLAAAEQLVPHIVRTGMAMQDEFFRLTGSEVKRTVGPLWAAMADTPDAPDWLRQTANFVGRGSGQWQTILAGTATGAAMGGGLLSLITNEMAPAVSRIIATNPNIRLAPADAAAAAVRGLVGPTFAYGDASGNGINAERFNVLKALNELVLSPPEIIELSRRGIISADEAYRLFVRAGFNSDHALMYLRLAHAVIGMPDAVAMWNRSIITTEEMADIATANGYTEAEGRKFAELGGEPPSPELLYTAFRRGIIDTDRLRRGIVQGPIRNEWFDVLEAVQFHSMTPEQAADAVNQGHMPLDRGKEIAKEYGLRDDDFSTIVETAGRPPGIDFAAEAYLRGFLTDDEWAQMFLESAVKNRYLPVLRKMRTALLPQETARSIYAKGLGDVEWITNILHGHGYSPDDIDKMVAAAHVEKTAPTRDLSLSAVRELYAEQEISQADAIDMLKQLGYDDQEAQWELALADLARVRTYRNAVVTRVRAGFVKGLISPEEASSTLDGLNVPASRRDELITVWGIERDTVTRDLTPAQLVSAAKKGLMDPSAALSRLIGQGYAQQDATVLLGLSGVTV